MKQITINIKRLTFFLTFVITNIFISSRVYSQVTPQQTVVNFYKWYTKNRKHFNNYYPIENPNDTASFFILNEARLNIFLNRFLKSDMVSDIFISDIRQFYENINVDLLVRPRKGQMVEGMEADIIYQTLEEEDFTQHLNEFRTLSSRINEDKALVLLGLGKYYRIKAYLSKQNNKWLIDHFTNYSIAYTDKQ